MVFKVSTWNIRVFVASLGAGLLGAAITAIWLYLLNTFLVIYPLRNMGLSLLFGLPSGFVTCFSAYQLYARAGFEIGSLFGALAGAVSGAATGVGWIIASYYGYLQPVGSELFVNGLVGAMLGIVTGAIMGKIFGPLLAKTTRIKY